MRKEKSEVGAERECVRKGRESKLDGGRELRMRKRKRKRERERERERELRMRVSDNFEPFSQR
jgi:hypothetical protein